MNYKLPAPINEKSPRERRRDNTKIGAGVIVATGLIVGGATLFPNQAPKEVVPTAVVAVGDPDSNNSGQVFKVTEEGRTDPGSAIAYRFAEVEGHSTNKHTIEGKDTLAGILQDGTAVNNRLAGVNNSQAQFDVPMGATTYVSPTENLNHAQIARVEQISGLNVEQVK